MVYVAMSWVFDFKAEDTTALGRLNTWLPDTHN
jgi:hypothetical protein